MPPLLRGRTSLIARYGRGPDVVGNMWLEICDSVILGMEDVTATRFSDLRYPPYCYYKQETDSAGRRGLKFNTAAASTASCEPLRPCLCRKEGKCFLQQQSHYVGF